MTVKLEPPGRRGKFWQMYGRLSGKVIDRSTKTLDEKEAKAVLRLFLKQQTAKPKAAPAKARGTAPAASWAATPLAAAASPPVPATPAERTWEEAVRAYAAKRHTRAKPIDLDWQVDGTQRMEAKRIRALFETKVDGVALGNKPVRLVTPDDIHAVCNELADQAEHRSGKAWTNQTKNRQVLSYARSVMVYAAANNWMAPWRLGMLPQPETPTRALSVEQGRIVMAAAKNWPTVTEWPKGRKGNGPRPHEVELIVLWFFTTGMRLSDTLRNAKWYDPSSRDQTGIDLAKGEVRYVVRKTGRIRGKALRPEMIEALERCVPPEHRVGRLFRWKPVSRANLANRTLKALEAETGIYFTPHMARHSGATWLDDEGVSETLIGEFLDHVPGSTATKRYNKGTRNRLDEALKRLPNLTRRPA